MGEVYRATDTNLMRQVAIKVLPASVAADADRLARFQREAQVLAALIHPNIAAFYGLESTARRYQSPRKSPARSKRRSLSGSVVLYPSRKSVRADAGSAPNATDRRARTDCRRGRILALGQWRYRTAGAKRGKREPVCAGGIVVAHSVRRYFFSPDLQMMPATVRTSGASLETDKPVPLFRARVPRGGAAEEKHQYDVSRDGRFLINEIADAAGSSPITLILNWRPKAK